MVRYALFLIAPGLVLVLGAALIDGRGSALGPISSVAVWLFLLVLGGFVLLAPGILIRRRSAVVLSEESEACDGWTMMFWHDPRVNQEAQEFLDELERQRQTPPAGQVAGV